MSPKHLLLCTLLAAGLWSPLRAAEQTPTPFSTLLDFEQLRRAPSGDLPIWLERVEVSSESTGGERLSTVRIQLRSLPGLSDLLLLRLFFSDTPGQQPMVSGWSETGQLLYQTPPLGSGLGLISSESLSIPTEGIDYLEIEAPGDGSSLRQALLATLQFTEAVAPLDRIPLPPDRDALSLSTEAAGEESDQRDHPPPELDKDSFLFGRTRAQLHPGPIRMESETLQTVHFEFTLSSQPLLAMIILSLHNADPAAPLLSWMNRQPTGPVAVQFPDLADPGYHAVVSHGRATPHFRYAGRLKAQITLPGHTLRAGKNTLSLQLPSEAGPVALENIELQLKYHWHKLDYSLERPAVTVPLPALSTP